MVPTFRRRINKEGKWDSICLRCFMAVRPPFGVRGAADLVEAELLHVCERAPTIQRLN